MNGGLVLIPRASQPVMPWANGGGSTRQVAIEPPDGSLPRGFHWRISIAQVASDGPFSHLPGIDRSLWLLSGAGMRLDVDGREVVLDRALQRLDARGETPIVCRLLAGPCEDLNVMVARDRVGADANVHELAAQAQLAVDVTGQGVVLALRGAFTAEDVVVGEREALRVDGPCRITLTAHAAAATVLVATFRPRA